MYPTIVSINGEDEYIVLIFNSYGGVPLNSMATIVQGLINGDTVKRVSVSNNNRTSGGIYVNSGGFIIGSEAAAYLIHHLDLGFKNNYDGNVRGLRRRNATVSRTGAIINNVPMDRGAKVQTTKDFQHRAYKIQQEARRELREDYMRYKALVKH